jgi:hypothetical protein
MFNRDSIEGIPSDADLNRFEDHWQHCYSANPQAITILTELFRNFDEVNTLGEY